MLKIRIVMPKTAGCSGDQDRDLEVVPRVGEYIKDVNNRYYEITAVIYQPFERAENNPPPQIEVRVAEKASELPWS